MVQVLCGLDRCSGKIFDIRCYDLPGLFLIFQNLRHIVVPFVPRENGNNIKVRKVDGYFRIQITITLSETAATPVM